MHNTYFTLPVLVAMLSNHYGWLYSGERNWEVLVLLMLACALVRHRFVARHKAQMQSKGISFDSVASIKRHAPEMYQQAVVLKQMPLNNATQITAAERDLIKRW